MFPSQFGLRKVKRKTDVLPSLAIWTMKRGAKLSPSCLALNLHRVLELNWMVKVSALDLQHEAFQTTWWFRKLK
jgi:hypothetical protein